MVAEEDNMVLRLLRELREGQQELKEAQAATDAKVEAISGKLDKLTVEVIGVKGRLRKVEEGMEAIAGVLSRELDLLK
jgi:hypothetical protein